MAEEAEPEVADERAEEADDVEAEPEVDRVLSIAQEGEEENATNGAKDSETKPEEEAVNDDKPEVAAESDELNDKPLQTVSGALELHFEVNFRISLNSYKQL